MTKRQFLFALFFSAVVAVSCASAQPVVEIAPTTSAAIEATRVAEASSDERSEEASKESLQVMTLNLAHGRADSFHQALLRRSTILDNLNRVADVLQREAPDVVACQEADGPSFWSGDFNHVAYLADKAGFGWRLRGEHVRGLGLSYGTAIMSRLALSDADVHTFEQSAPTPPKGFSLSTVDVGGTEVDVASVHLDFASEDNRYNQAKQLVERLERRERPTIVMGDLNTEADGRAFRHLTEALDLKAHRPDDDGLPTYGSNKRLDWILASPELEIASYEVLEDDVSDHRGVLAELRFKDDFIADNRAVD